jgi:Domain of unknown function (DUF4282)
MTTMHDPHLISARPEQVNPYSPYRYPDSGVAADHGPKALVRALLQPTAERGISTGAARSIYVVLSVGIILTWVILVIIGFSRDAMLGILALLLGWIPAVLWIASARIVLEFSTAVNTVLERSAGELPTPGRPAPPV